MARPVDAFPSDESYPSRPKYPWDTWFDGRVWLLVHGEDFHVPTKHMQIMCHQTANRRGGTVATRIIGNELYIQFNA